MKKQNKNILSCILVVLSLMTMICPTALAATAPGPDLGPRTAPSDPEDIPSIAEQIPKFVITDENVSYVMRPTEESRF